ncbi:hypothetical protein BASA81_003579 [Batrachochytrium salamandrivorans]|nr:hypothetical protein BASA81_003579 [Batrachochytrium salamandrivorans]
MEFAEARSPNDTKKTSSLRRFSTTAVPFSKSLDNQQQQQSVHKRQVSGGDLKTPNLREGFETQVGSTPDRFASLGEAKLSLVRNRSASLMNRQQAMASGGSARRLSFQLSPKSREVAMRGKQIKLKEGRVRKALDSPEMLRGLALEDLGLVNNELRKIAWGTLLAVHRRRTSSTSSIPEMPANRDLDKLATDHRQITLDCNRKFHFGQQEEQGAANDHQRRERLEAFLHSFFDSNLDLFYYQGFHDLCGALLSTIDSNNGSDNDELLTRFLVEKICRTTVVRDAARETMDAVFVQLQLVHFIIEQFEPRARAQDPPRVGDQGLALGPAAPSPCIWSQPWQYSPSSPPPGEGEDEELDVLGALKNSMKSTKIADADLLVRMARVMESTVPVARTMEHACYRLKLPTDSFLRTSILFPLKLFTVALFELNRALGCWITCGRVMGLSLFEGSQQSSTFVGGSWVVIQVFGHLGSIAWGLACIVASADYDGVQVMSALICAVLVLLLVFAKS